jgi:hypothetical protein
VRWLTFNLTSPKGVSSIALFYLGKSESTPSYPINMRIADIVHSRQFAAGQILSRETAQHFQLELTRVSTALTNKAGTAMMPICPNPSSD